MPDGSAFPAMPVRDAASAAAPRWGRAAGLALVLHATMALPIVLALETVPQPAMVEGVELAPPMPEAAAPAEAEESPAEAVAAASPDQPEAAAGAPPDQPEVAANAPPEPVQAAEPPPESTQATDMPPEQTEPVAMAEVAPTPPVAPLPSLAPEAPLAEMPPAETIAAALPPPPAPMPPPPRPVVRPRAVAAATPAPSGPPREAPPAATPAATAPVPAAAPPRRPSAGYIGALLAALERHKDYPLTARHRRAEGTAMLRFAMRRDGSVASWRLERSTGDADLDAAVGQMVRRASPLPAPPGDLPGDPIELVVPVRFVLR